MDDEARTIESTHRVPRASIRENGELREMAIIQLTRRGRLRSYSMPTIKFNFDQSSKHRAGEMHAEEPSSGGFIKALDARFPRMRSAAHRGHARRRRLITVDYLNFGDYDPFRRSNNVRLARTGDSLTRGSPDDQRMTNEPRGDSETPRPLILLSSSRALRSNEKPR